MTVMLLKQNVENGYNLGGEQSGHIIFLDHNNDWGCNAYRTANSCL